MKWGYDQITNLSTMCFLRCLTIFLSNLMARYRSLVKRFIYQSFKRIMIGIQLFRLSITLKTDGKSK